MKDKKLSAAIGLVILVIFALGVIQYLNSHPRAGISLVSQKTTSKTKTVYPTVTPANTAVSNVKIYLIALNDNGKSGKATGCGDSVVAIQRDILPTTAPLRASLEQLFASKDQYYGQSKLYNALYQSNLLIDYIEVNKGGIASIELAGSYKLGGVCDGPRFVSQIQQTVLQFKTITSANILVNGKPLEQIASEK